MLKGIQGYEKSEIQPFGTGLKYGLVWGFDRWAGVQE